MRALCAREHPVCFACRPPAKGGLGLSFVLQSDSSVAANWTCPPGCESYAGIVHGGLLATALDSAMVHTLFARDIVARTGELNVRFYQSVRSGEPTAVTGRLRDAHPPLFQLEAEIRQAGVLCARASGKFMANRA
jgi:acyl-coenzyme A thioesterase PaaI-like protein